MAKLVTIHPGRTVNRNGSTPGPTKPVSRTEQTPLARLKLPYAVAAVLVALACLCAAVLQTRGVGGDNERSLSQARVQAHHKWAGIKS